MYTPSDAIAIYRGWEVLEQRLPEGEGVAVIDFDLAPQFPNAEQFDSREQVLRRIRQLRDEVQVQDQTSEFVRAKLNASAFYLRLLLGETAEFYEHVRHMLGVTPELISEDTVSEQERRVIGLMASLGVAIRDGHVVSDEFEQFERSLTLTKGQAEAEVQRIQGPLLEITLDLLGYPGVEVPYRIEIADVDAYWKAWASGKKGEYLLRFNFNRKHHWRQGDMLYLTLHEVCGHFVQAELMAQEIDRGDLDPFLGVTTVHTPDALQAEGIADALTYFFPDDLPFTGLAELNREQRILNKLLDNNAHILINMGRSKQEMLDYLMRNPFNASVTESVSSDLDAWVSHPLWRAYQYSYGIAMKHHLRLAQRLDREQKRHYLRGAFTRPMTPTQLIAYGERLAGF